MNDQPKLPPAVVDAFWKRWGSNTFLSAQGLELELGEVGRAVVHLRAPTAAQRGGGGSDSVINGGVIAYMFDAALGCAIASANLARPEMREVDPGGLRQSTINLDITYVDAAAGARFEAHGRVVRSGRSVAFAEGELLDDRGRVCATAKGIWRIFWPHRDRTAG
ncbi:MAG: PaaI family thioesterase [Burkholderiales bacterium]|nr:PaaI family thioesterase [Burkholderiales bacterium]